MISAGANEIYCGVEVRDIGYAGLSTRRRKYSLSSYDELGRVVCYAHDHGVKTIVTTEFPFMAEVIEKEVKKHIRSCAEEGVDAFIATDIGTIMTVKDMGLDIPIYASTYLASMNYEAVHFLAKLGVERVILERQLTIGEIREVVQRCKGVEIEVFVHGPGCSNINVNCYGCTAQDIEVRSSSSYPQQSSGEPFVSPMCMITWEVYEVGNEGKKIADAPILDAFSFCSICQLPDLVKTGVTGLKIVGRELSQEYQEKATKMYRELVGMIERGEIESLEKLKPIRSSEQVIPTDFCEQKRCYYSPFFHAPYKVRA